MQIHKGAAVQAGRVDGLMAGVPFELLPSNKDSIVEVNGTTGQPLNKLSRMRGSKVFLFTGDVAQMLDKCKTDVELEHGPWNLILLVLRDGQLRCDSFSTLHRSAGCLLRRAVETFECFKL